MTGPSIATFHRGNGPLIATAIHAGSFMRRSVLPYCKLERSQRLREEDPFTEKLAEITNSCIVGERSRFEVDLNRSREKAIYLRPEDAWGLDVWQDLPQQELQDSLSLYDAFYQEVDRMVSSLLNKFQRVVVFDIHSYNHQRGGEGQFDDPKKNPEINIGTGNMDRQEWAPVVNMMIESLRQPTTSGRELDVRENVKFRGGHFSRWLNQRFGSDICAIAIEFKKIFMNEWTGIPDLRMIEELRYHLERTAASVVAHLHERQPG